MIGWESKYTIAPFRDHGRDLSGLDCWGLVRLVYAQELNITLPNFAEISPSDLRKVARMIDGAKDGEEWLSVIPPNLKPFDVVVMSQYGGIRNAHVGLITNAGKVMHIERGSNVLVLPLDHYSIRERIRCFRRNKNRA